LVKTPTALFAGSAEAENVPARRVRWNATYRLIPSRYPPIDLFERVAPPGDWDALQRLDELTDPGLRDQIGNIRLVPPDKRVGGPGATIVMAPFTHCSRLRPTPFSDGSFGIYYAGRRFETALLEVSFHMARFHAATADPPMHDQMRAYRGAINKVMNDIRGGGYEALLRRDVSSYDRPQAFARMLRAAGSNGIVYPSVRHQGGECIAVFWPNVVAIPTPERHVDLKWDGQRITAWFDHHSETWQPLPK
jgi:RES domain